MPTMWSIRGGRVPYTEFGPGTPLSFDEAVARFATEEIRFMGPKAPSIAPGTPSKGLENVVLQVNGEEGSNLLLPESGFYRVASLHPDVARARLHNERC